MVNFQSDAMSMVHFSTAMRYRLFLEKLNIAIVAIIFLDHRERLFFDYFAHFRTDYFGIIHDLPPHFRPKELLMSSFIRINLQTDSVKCIFTPFPGPRHMLTETKFVTDLATQWVK